MEALKNAIISGAGSIVATLAGIDWFLIYLYCFFMVLDLLTGWYKAKKNKTFETTKMKQGLIGKVIELVIVFGLLFLQKAFADFGIVLIASNFILFGFGLKEFLSIMENWTEAGQKIPSFIENWLKVAQEKLNEKIGGKNDENVEK